MKDLRDPEVQEAWDTFLKTLYDATGSPQQFIEAAEGFIEELQASIVEVEEGQDRADLRVAQAGYRSDFRLSLGTKTAERARKAAAKVAMQKLQELLELDSLKVEDTLLEAELDSVGPSAVPQKQQMPAKKARHNKTKPRKGKGRGRGPAR